MNLNNAYIYTWKFFSYKCGRVLAMDYTVRKLDNELLIGGIIDEYCDLNDILPKRANKNVTLDLSKVVKVDPSGLKSWAQYLSSTQAEIHYKKCSIPVIEGFNEVPSILKKNSKIDSFECRFYCDRCDVEYNQVLEIGRNFDPYTREIPKYICKHCNTGCSFDHSEEEYFRFLQDFYGPKRTPIKSRRFHLRRKKLDTKVILKESLGDLKFKDIASINICGGGIYCQGSYQFEEGSHWYLEFEVPFGNSMVKINCLAEIRWIKPAGDKDIFGYGLEFLEISENDEDILEEFLALM